MKGPPPLRIELGRSRLAVAFIVAAYFATATLVAFMPGPALLRAIAVAAIGAYSVWSLRRSALQTERHAIVGVEISADGRVVLIERGGATREGRAQPACYIGTWFTTLVVRIDGRRWSRAIAILPDMLSAEELRRLRVMLRAVGSLPRSDRNTD
jgi:hypothetical protein